MKQEEQKHNRYGQHFFKYALSDINGTHLPRETKPQKVIAGRDTGDECTNKKTHQREHGDECTNTYKTLPSKL